MNQHLQVLLESLRKLLRRNAQQRVSRLLKKSHNVDVAFLMRYLNEAQRQQVFDLLPTDQDRAETLSELDQHIFLDIVEGRSIEQMSHIIGLMNVDDQTNILSELPEQVRTAILNALQPDEAQELTELLHYERDTAGGLMSTEFFSLPEKTTCEEAIEALQSAEDIEMAFYIYVVDPEMRLSGVVSLRALVINPPQTYLSDIKITDIISVNINQDQEDVASLAARYNLLAIPVVDESSELVGIITIDDVIDVIREEATEDILKMAGADESAFEDSSSWSNFLTRAPWLFATWIGGLSAGLLIGVFEHQLDPKIALSLATFIPIVLGMGGNVGTQTATIMVRGLATGRVEYGLGVRYFVREMGVGAMLGVFYGILLASYVSFLEGEAYAFAFTVGISIWASMITATMVGASVPLFFHKIKVDPAVATGPLVTTSVDVLGILVYYIVAQYFMVT